MTAPARNSIPLRHPAVIGLLLVIATLTVYWPAGSFGFINYDDPLYVSENPPVLGGLGGENISWAFRTGHAGFWQPLTWLSFMLDVSLFGPRAGAMHLTNVLLHAANTVLLFWLLWRLTAARWRSALVAALFALHPLHVESVAWITERKDVLSTFFGLLAVIFYARYAQRKASGHQLSTINYQLSLGFFALGLMSKPMLVTLPFLLLLLDYWPLGRFGLSTINYQLSTFLRLLAEKAPFLLLSLAAGVVTVVLHQHTGILAATDAVSLPDRLGNAVVSYARYLGKLVWPVGLANPYPFPNLAGHWDWPWLLGAALLFAGLTAFAVRTRRACPFYLMGWIWFVISLLPVIGLIQAGPQAMADRFVYVPMIGIYFALVWGAAQILARRPAPALAAAMAILLLGACALRSRDQLNLWRDSETLFRHTVAVTPNNYVAHNNFGLALAGQGKLPEAIAQYRAALHAQPRFAEAWNNLGFALAGQGDLTSAIDCYRAALRQDPRSTVARINLADALLRSGALAEAVALYQQALPAAPGNAGLHNNLGVALSRLGRHPDAIIQFEAALRCNPDFAVAHFSLGRELIQAGRQPEAILHFRAALRLKPDYQAPRDQLHQLNAD